MRRFVVLFTLAALTAAGAFACGDGNKQPPLTPDQDHVDPSSEAGAPATPATPATPAK